MMAKVDFWAPERVERLKTMWGEEHSASVIAGKLCCTRNAVIGKVHRLGLLARRERVNPLRAKQMHEPVAKSPARHVRRKSKKAVVTPVEPSKADAPAFAELFPRHQLLLVSFAEMGPGMCRWPFGDSRGEGFDFCGAGKKPGSSYCAAHHGLAYAVRA